MDPETKRFIIDHAKDDIFTLKLNFKNDSGVDIDLAIRQINGRQKIKFKIPTFYFSEDLHYPVQLSLEQSSSEATAIYKSNICNGQSLVDLTGGFGVDCYFMSTHFKEVSYVERQEELCELARHNFRILGKEYIKVFCSDTEAFLDTIEHADWIYIDPARRSAGGNKVVLLSDCEPDVSYLYPLLMEKATRVMIKLSPMMDITAALRELPNTSEIHILSVENECKEVLLVLDQQVRGSIKIRTINLGKNKEQQVFEYNLEEESIEEISYSTTLDKYLYEPNASIMKSGAFKLIGKRFGLHKLHINTHLYTSNVLYTEFPGRVFEITHVWGNSKKELHDLSKKVPKANITTRNYPISVDELRKKLKIKEGGSVYLFACSLYEDQKLILETIKTSN